MKQEKLIETLAQKLKIRGEQSRISEAIGVSKSTVKRWLEDKDITPAHSKLLSLYFYGEMPFELIRPEQDISSILKFTGSEWKIITILATREGYISPQAWITAQIRGYLRNIERADISEYHSVAEDETPYNVVDPINKENNNGGKTKKDTL